MLQYSETIDKGQVCSEGCEFFHVYEITLWAFLKSFFNLEFMATIVKANLFGAYTTLKPTQQSFSISIPTTDQEPSLPSSIGTYGFARILRVKRDLIHFFDKKLSYIVILVGAVELTRL